MRSSLTFSLTAAILGASTIVATAQIATPRETSPVPNTEAEVRSEGRQTGGSPPASAVITSPGATVVPPPVPPDITTGSIVPLAPGTTSPTAEPDNYPTTNSLTGTQQRNQLGAE